ncbi:MAG: DUF2252 domain-containing protein [Anaerolineae bacterium]|nr:DUF2252 domain-containing protein [Anaerolineae bacterium]
MQATWTPPANRVDPIDILIASSQGRIENLIPLRYGRMMASPFAFYRGAASIMASDLAHTPNSGFDLQICGDCHLLNFGGFATPERQLVFDINDFDETSLAPWEWDVKRLAASLVIAGQSNGFKAAVCQEAAWLAAQSYREHMAEFSEMSVLEAWYEAIDLDNALDNSPDKDMAKFYRKKLKAALEQNAHEKEFAKLAHENSLPARIIDQPPLIYHFNGIHDEEFRAIAERTYASYKESLSTELHLLLDRYRVHDVAFKVVGVGSVGTMCGIILLMSQDEPLFLQFKEARQSVLEPFAGTSRFDHPGRRVVAGQRLMQAASDMFLGWATGGGEEKRPFYMRQLRDAKIKPVVEVMKPNNLFNYAGLCGHALARAHARSGDTLVLTSYMGKNNAFEDALADFAVAYAQQNEQDHQAMVTAVRAGRIQIQTEE